MVGMVTSCILWMFILQVSGAAVNLDGTMFVRDVTIVNATPPVGGAQITRSLTDCALTCTQSLCNGFFYNSLRGYCILVTNNNDLGNLTHMEHVTFYKSRALPQITQQVQHNYPKFEKDLTLRDVIPVDMNGQIQKTYVECETLCEQQQTCRGFFYKADHSHCIIVTEYFLPTLGLLPGMYFYKRIELESGHHVTLEVNVCPPVQDGPFRINVTSERHYDLYMQPRGISQTVAISECNTRGMRLLRLEEDWQHKAIVSLLNTCKDFKHSQFWIGAEKDRNSGKWVFPDGELLNMNYFCGYAPNSNGTPFCVRFLRGCLDDLECIKTAGVLCENK